MNNPLFSIIVPVYNVEHYLEQCCESILNQDNVDLELIIIDDGSTDNSAAICDIYLDDDRVTIVHKENGGLSDARNVGLLKARGKYVLFVDSDDFLEDTNFLSNVSDKISNNDYDLLVFGYKKYYEESGTYKAFLPNISSDYLECSLETLIERNLYVLSAWGKIIKKSVLKENQLFFTKEVLSEDMDWCIRLATVIDNINVIKVSPYIYRQRKGSITKTPSKKKIDDLRNNIIRSIDIINTSGVSKNRENALKIFLTQYISMYLINISLMESDIWEEELQFIKECECFLDYAIRTREKIVRFLIKMIGIRKTLKVLKMVNEYVKKV